MKRAPLWMIVATCIFVGTACSSDSDTPDNKKEADAAVDTLAEGSQSDTAGDERTDESAAQSTATESPTGDDPTTDPTTDQGSKAEEGPNATKMDQMSAADGPGPNSEQENSEQENSEQGAADGQPNTDAGMSAETPEAAADRAGTLRGKLEARLRGDRSGACIAAAMLRGDQQLEQAIVCADPKDETTLSFSTPFEIGSITKTMTAFAIATLIDAGRISLEDPLADYLPASTIVPDFAGEPIRIKHVLTHTAGLPRLPSLLTITDQQRPYENLTKAQVLNSLADVTLTTAPGESFNYSNFGFMLLSIVVSEASGQPYPDFLTERLFEPAGMEHSFITATADSGLAQGHVGSRHPVAAWDFAPEIAGAGGVRASLQDMVQYAEAALGQGPASVTHALSQAITPIPLSIDVPTIGLAWIQETVGDRTFWWHNGGTGGFSTFMAVDPEHNEALVLLADTAMSATQAVDSLAYHLLAPDVVPAQGPRTPASAPDTLLEALAGVYQLADLVVTLEAQAGQLLGRIAGQRTLVLSYDSAGEFFPVDMDAVLVPVKQDDDTYTFEWIQDGVTIPAQRMP